MTHGAAATGRSTVRTVALLAGAYLLLTLAYTWPLPVHLAHGVAHDSGDPILNAWILWWSTQALPLTDHWWNAPAFYPATGVLAFSEHLLGLAPIAAPLIAITHLPLLGYNVALIATFVLSALGAHFLAYTLTRRHDAAFVAGLAYAFAPYRLAQLPHIQVLSSYWAPVCLAALHKSDRDGRVRWAILASGAWLLQALSCGYYFFFLSVLLVFWILWFAVGRWPLRRILVLAAAFAVATIVLMPVLHGYKVILQDTYGMSRSLQEIQSYSADIAGLLYGTDELLVWGWVHVVHRAESNLFPGITIAWLVLLALRQSRPFAGAETSPFVRRMRAILAITFVLLLIATIVPIVYGTWRLTIAGVRLVSIARADKPVTLAVFAGLAWMSTLPRIRAAWQRRSALAFYLLAAFAMWVFALGPDPTLLDMRALYQAPYGWLMRLPGFDGLRVPARFWMMSLVCLSVVAGLAISRVSTAMRRRTLAIATLGLLLDGWPRQFTVLPAPELRRAPVGADTRLDLPVSDDRDALALYQQPFDPIPLINGFSGYGAPHYYAMRVMLTQHDPRILLALTANRSLGVLIDHEGDADGAVRRYMETIPGATLSETRPTWSSYRLPISHAASPPDREGRPLRIKSLLTFPSPPHAVRALDGDLRTRWSGGLQQQSAEMTIVLEQPSHVGQVVLDLGIYITDFPSRLQIDASADGTTWEPVWTGDTALQAYYGAVRHPREMPLVFPVNRDGVGLIRLRQIGFGTHDWSVAEVHVLQ
jgi:hypothetical protein